MLHDLRLAGEYWRNGETYACELRTWRPGCFRYAPIASDRVLFSGEGYHSPADVRRAIQNHANISGYGALVLEIKERS